jgi:methyltransferase (TIGR00027 family)
MAVSRTAEYVAMFRAVESARPAADRLFDDPYAIGFLSGKLAFGARVAGLPGGHRLVCRYIDRNWPGSRPSAVVRTRLIDDAVAEGLEDGAKQLAILGAGYDTRGMRLPAAARIPVFELDQSPTQERKKERLLKRDGELPANIRYVPFDLLQEGVGAPLGRGGFVSGLKSVYVWEGVLSYLTPEAVDQTLGWVRSSGASGSRIVFTYVDISLLEQNEDGDAEPPWSAQVAKVGEPFRYGLDPADLEGFLATRGFELVWDLSTAEALRQNPGITGAKGAPGFYHVAMAEIQ